MLLDNLLSLSLPRACRVWHSNIACSKEHHCCCRCVADAHACRHIYLADLPVMLLMMDHKPKYRRHSHAMQSRSANHDASVVAGILASGDPDVPPTRTRPRLSPSSSAMTGASCKNQRLFFWRWCMSRDETCVVHRDHHRR